MARIISPKRGSALNPHSHAFIRRYVERVTSQKRKKVPARCRVKVTLRHTCVVLRMLYAKPSVNLDLFT